GKLSEPDSTHDFFWRIKRAVPEGAALFTIGLPYFLPVELHAYLNLAGKHVLRGNRRRTDHAERGARRAGVKVGHQAEEVVVHEIERFEAELDPNAFRELGHLQQRCIQSVSVMAPDLAGAERIVVRSVTGGGQPRVVSTVRRAAAKRLAARL